MKWIYRFFVVLGVLFFLILIGIGYFVIADPYNLRPLIMGMYATQIDSDIEPLPVGGEQSAAQTTDDATPADEVTTQPAGVSPTQAKALESVGINPETVPPQFTPEQISCFVGILGQARVDAIVAGAVPTPAEFFQAKDCL